MHRKTIVFIGAGNMARSLIGGLIQGGCDPALIRACDPDPAQRERLANQYPVETAESMDGVVPGADCIVLAVKPQTLRPVSEALGPLLGQANPLILSVAAGVREHTIGRWLGEKRSIVRCMPNTPALIQAGATALYANPAVSESQRELAESIMRAVGITLWLDDEALMDAVTALSGSGPAYLFLVTEAIQQGGQTLGLAPEQARLLALQTVFGAAKMALEDNEPLADLRQRVTSRGGTTERALQVFEQGGLVRLFESAMTAARDRSRELARELDQN